MLLARWREPAGSVLLWSVQSVITGRVVKKSTEAAGTMGQKEERVTPQSPRPQSHATRQTGQPPC